jgi:hypothetical protein
MTKKSKLPTIAWNFMINQQKNSLIQNAITIISLRYTGLAVKVTLPKRKPVMLRVATLNIRLKSEMVQTMLRPTDSMPSYQTLILPTLRRRYHLLPFVLLAINYRLK